MEKSKAHPMSCRFGAIPAICPPPEEFYELPPYTTTMIQKIKSEVFNSTASKSHERPRTIPLSKQFFGHTEKRWITFGSVQVLVRMPTASELSARKREANSAMRGLTKLLKKRGLKIVFKPTTPRFESDPLDPRLVIRTLNGKRLRGTFVNGVFSAVL